MSKNENMQVVLIIPTELCLPAMLPVFGECFQLSPHRN